MSDNCCVSVIMSVYNINETWLRESVESILNQTFSNFEFIIVLDSPTDNSERVVLEYAEKDPRIVVLKNENNIGLTCSLNKALKKAKGQYIARMDADDISIAARFEKQVAYLNTHKNVAAVGTRCFRSVSMKPLLNDWTEDQEALAIRMLFHNAGIAHPTAMIRRSVLTEHNIQYTESIKKSQDYKLWVDLLPYGKLMVLPDILLIYREHEDQITSNTTTLNIYAQQITLELANKLMGMLTESEKKLHLSVMDNDDQELNPKELDRYFKRMVAANREKKIYRQDKFERELDYLWCRKAIRRFAAKKKADMLLYPRSLKLISPAMIKYINENKRRSQDYLSAIDSFKQQIPNNMRLHAAEA